MLRECFSLWLSRSFCGPGEVWSRSNADNKAQYRGEKKNRFKFFLSCNKTLILTQGLELLYFGVVVCSYTKSTSLYLITAGLVFKVPQGEHLCFCLLERGFSVLYYLLEFAQTQVH